MKKKSICLVPEAKSLGGPRTFQQNLISFGAVSGETEFHFDAEREDIDAFLVIGGPKDFLRTLLRARRKGIPVVQRLNGMNWIHRKRPCTLRYKIHSEAANLAIAFFRRFVCTKIVYQSPFCQERWNRTYGTLSKPQTIIFNGTDLSRFSPDGAPDVSERIEILLVEGSFRYGMDFGLDVAVELANALSERMNRPVTLRIAGKTEPSAVTRVKEKSAGSVQVEFLGIAEKDEIIRLARKSALFFSSEIHAACPNAVIEALSCGLPVIGFDTGALKDVVGKGGIVVPYGTDPWNLEFPVTEPLIDAAETVVRENAAYRSAARKQAEEHFDIASMGKRYTDFCTGIA